MTKTRDLADLGGGFIQAGSGAVQRTVESKLQDVVSVKDFGAVGDGVADDTAAIQAAIESLVLGGDVEFPVGTYKTTGTIRVSSNRTGLVFRDGAKLLPIGSFDSLRFESLTAATFIYGNRIVNGLLDETGKTGGRTFVGRYIAECDLVLQSGNGYDGILLDTFNTVDLTARLTNYTSSTCDYVRVQGGAAGQARSDVLRIHSLTMGGTYVNGQDGLVIDGFVHTVAGSHVYAINVGGRPLHVLNSVAALDIPTFLTFFDLETDFCKNAVYLQTCQVVELVSSIVNGAREDHGVLVGSGCIDARINGGRFTGNKLAGIAISNAGTIVKGAKLAANSSNVAPVTGTLNTYPGILIGGTSSGAVVTGCRLGDAASSTFQSYGIQIDTGATNFIISNNDVRNNATSGIADGSSATDGYIANNNGYTAALSAFTAGASPYTYRAGHSAESVYIYGGTVSDIALGGATVFTTTDRTVTLGPNQTVVITHTVAPTILKMPH